MAIPKKRLEELTCQFLMMSEILCKDCEEDILQNLGQLTDATDEELEELNFPMKMYQRERKKQQNSQLHNRNT